MELTIKDVKPYDGTYTLDFTEELTSREFGWIKRLSGYLPINVDEAIEGADAEFMCVLAAIALHRAGRVETRDVPAVFDRLADAPFGSAITMDLTDQPDDDEGDAGPPVTSSSESSSSSGTDSETSSETLPATPPDSGTPDSDSSESAPLKSVG